jgi:hypothetical protein
VYQYAESRRLRVNAVFDELLHRAPSPERQGFYVQKLATQSDTWLRTRLAASQEYFDNAV